MAAGSVVLEGTHIEANSIYAGIPAKKVKDLPDDKRKSHKTYRRRISQYEIGTTKKKTKIFQIDYSTLFLIKNVVILNANLLQYNKN